MKPHIVQAGPHALRLDDKTYVMGIVNVTPDSFSDGGKYDDTDRAIDHVARLEREGVDMLDIGGESTRPGFEPVSEEEELERVIPKIEAISARFPLPISVDTYKAEVAHQALQAGAHIINDIWGAKRDPRMAQVVADYQAPIILMHNRDNKDYTDLMQDLIRDIQHSVTLVKEAGLSEDKIILDPGIGFAKNFEQNLEVMRHLERVVDVGYPVLLGTSRKRFIGRILDTEADERVEGTMATVSFGVQKGCHIVRVHDVKEAVRTVKMIDAMTGKRDAVYG